MKLATLVETSTAVAATRSRNAKRDALAACLRAMAPAEVQPGTSYLAGALPQGRIGVGTVLLRKVAATASPAAEHRIDLAEADSAFDAIANMSGKGSAGARRERLEALFSRATESEQSFLVRLPALPGPCCAPVCPCQRVSPGQGPGRRGYVRGGPCTCP